MVCLGALVYICTPTRDNNPVKLLVFFSRSFFLKKKKKYYIDIVYLKKNSPFYKFILLQTYLLLQKTWKTYKLIFRYTQTSTVTTLEGRCSATVVCVYRNTHSRVSKSHFKSRMIHISFKYL